MSSSASSPTAVLARQLQAWVEETFPGVARLGGSPDRVRLHVGEGGARIGWDLRSAFIHVWVKALRDSDRELPERLSEPGSVSMNKADASFRIHTEADAQVLRAIVRAHVLAESASTAS